MKMIKNKRGIALPIAIFAIVIIAALVAALFFVGMQEFLVADNAHRATQSFGIAEAGTAEQIRNWNPIVTNQMGRYPGDSFLIAPSTSPQQTGSYSGVVYRLNNGLYFIDITGSDRATLTGRIRSGGARQRMGLLARVKPLGIDVRASLTTQGDVNVRGNSEINGTNESPAGWPSCVEYASDTMPDLAGVRTSGDVDIRGSSDVDGNPAVLPDPTINDSTFTQYDDISFDELAANATVQLGGGTYRTEPVIANGICNRASLTNWGDGLNPVGLCAGYYPIIYINGDAVLNGVQGQGILLVRGNLEVQGSYEFFGITVVLGEFKTSGGGNTDAHFWGAVFARNANISDQNMTGRATITYSACAVETVLNSTGIVTPLRSRGWSLLY